MILIQYGSMNVVSAVRVRHFLLWPVFYGLAVFLQFQSASLCAQPGAEDATFVPGFIQNGLVYAVALQTNGNIVVSGDFIVNGRLPRLARLLPNGALDTAFNVGDGPNNTIRNILVPVSYTHLTLPTILRV